MPEGHTIHALARDLNTLFAGRRVRAASPQGRFTAGAARLDGCVLAGFDAYGKHLVGRFDGLSEVLHIHLGLFGKIAMSAGSCEPDAGPGPGADAWIVDGGGGRHRRGHGDGSTVRLELRAPHAGGVSVMELRGATACELLDPPEFDMLLSRLGPDPLDEHADPERAWWRVHASARTIGELLMDQSVVAGVGNIYRAEVLFRAGVSPSREGRRVSHGVWQAMWVDLVELMGQGFRTGRIDTVRPEHMPEVMGRPPRVDAHGGEVYVYRRSGRPCLVCGTPIMQRTVAGRKVYWCPVCQDDGA